MKHNWQKLAGIVPATHDPDYEDERNLVDRNKTAEKFDIARNKYFDVLGEYKGLMYEELPVEDQGYLVLAWLAAAEDAEGWLVEAHNEQDLFLLDLDQIIDTQSMHDHEVISRRRVGLLDYFTGTIQEHLDDQHVLNW